MLPRSLKIKSLEINVWTFLLLGVGFFFDFAKMLIIAYLVTAIHETAHIITAKMCGIKVDGIEVLPFGITMRMSDNCIKSTASEMKIAIAGPLSNFATAYFVYGFYHGTYREYILTTALVMGIFNLLPALPMDGGRILRAAMVKKWGFIRASYVSVIISNVSAFCIIACGLYVLWLTRFNFSLLLVGGFLIANMTEERKKVNSIIMKDILYSRKKLGEAAEGEVLVVTMDERADKILKKLSYDRYFLINVVDSRMNVVKTLTETQLIENMAIYGMNQYMKKFVEL